MGTAPMTAGQGVAVLQHLRGPAGDVADAALRPSPCAERKSAPALRTPPVPICRRKRASSSFVGDESTPRRKRRVFWQEVPPATRDHGENCRSAATSIARSGRVCGSREGGSARAKATQPLQHEHLSLSAREGASNRREKKSARQTGATAKRRLTGGLSHLPAHFFILIAMAAAEQIPGGIEILRMPLDAPARQVFGSQPQVCLLLHEVVDILAAL